MENVRKKTRRPVSRGLLLGVALAALALTALLVHLIDGEEETAPSYVEEPEIQLLSCSVEDMLSLTVEVDGAAPWTAEVLEGRLIVTGEGGFTVDAEVSKEVLEAVTDIRADRRLSEAWRDSGEELSAFGLEKPETTLTIRTKSGDTWTIRIGSTPEYEATWQYAMIDGDDSLYAVSRGTAEALYRSRGQLRTVTQPVIHAERVDAITLRNGEGAITARWALQGAITATDAADRWWVEVPLTYPADAEALASLRDAAEGLHLGEFLTEATPEALTRYGFDTPKMTITIHQAAGTMGTVNAEGVYATTDFPESEEIFVLGGQENELVYYVLWEGGIYRVSRFLLNTLMNAEPHATLTRYPVLVALGNLASLSIQTETAETVYVLTRTEQVAPNNELVLDEEGQPVYDITLTRNGVAADYTAFAAAYERLMMVKVSGTLPDTWTQTPEHTRYTFKDQDGTMHTVALAPYDTMHDAVLVDGYAAFYIIQGGFSLGEL